LDKFKKLSYYDVDGSMGGGEGMELYKRKI